MCSRVSEADLVLFQGWTPVHCATSNKRAVSMLVAFGADINAKSAQVDFHVLCFFCAAALHPPQPQLHSVALIPSFHLCSCVIG